ncbi:MAG: hypothetical protein ACI8PZ_003129 [Myxococcota bacterium]|jgi:hypothetical protein
MSLLFLVAAAFAGGPMLSVVGECPGDVTIEATGLTPLERFSVLVGLGLGGDTIADGPCVGVVTGLAGELPRFRGAADGAGRFRVSPRLSPEMCGKAIQIIETGSCTLTNPVDLSDIRDGGGPVDGDVISEWTPFDFADNGHRDNCAGGEKYVISSVRAGAEHLYLGATLCSPTLYKLWMSDSLDGTFHAMGDWSGYGQDHCNHMPGGVAGAITWDSVPQSDWEGWEGGPDDDVPVFTFFAMNAWVPFDYECGVSIP